MAGENIGLGINLKFSTGGAEKKMNRVASAIGKVKGKIDSAGKAMNSVGSGMMRVGAGLSVATGAFGIMAKSATDFEQQMKNVQAVTNATAADFKKLQTDAKFHGATSSYSAKDVATLQEVMGRAGLNVQQITDSTRGVINLASAEGLKGAEGLASASEIVVGALKAFKLEASESKRVSDLLAKASASSNVSVISMGETFKDAASTAAQYGVSIEEVTLASGLLGNINIKGSNAATALKNSMLKLSKPTSKAKKYMEEFGFQVLRDEKGNMRYVDTLELMSKKLEGVKDKVKKGAIASEVLGLRGIGALGAVDAARADKSEGGGIEGLRGKLGNAQGAAEKMANTRLDTVYGQFTLLQSAVEGLAIELMSPFLDPFKESLKAVGGFVSQVVSGLQHMANPTDETKKAFDNLSPAIKNVVLGTKEVIDGFKDMYERAKPYIFATMKFIEDTLAGPFGKAIVKMIGYAMGIAAIAGPILLALGAVAMFIGSVVLPAFSAIASVASGIAEVVGAAIGAVSSVFGLILLPAIMMAIGIFSSFRNEGESVLTTLYRMFKETFEFIWSLLDSTIIPFAKGMMFTLYNAIKFIYKEFVSFSNDVFGTFSVLIRNLIKLFKRFGPIIGDVFFVLGGVIGAFLSGILGAMGSILKFTGLLFKAILIISGKIFEFLINPLIDMLQRVISAADGIGQGGLIPKSVRLFAEGGKFRFDPAEYLNAPEDSDFKDEKGGLPPWLEEQLKALDKFTEELGGKVEENTEETKKVNNNLNKFASRPIKNEVKISDKAVGEAAGRSAQDVADRTGAKTNPFNRRRTRTLGIQVG